MSALRARTQICIQDFSFNKGTPIQQAERAARAEEKKQRILLDKLLDEEELAEQRWPFKSVRGKVRCHVWVCACLLVSCSAFRHWAIRHGQASLVQHEELLSRILSAFPTWQVTRHKKLKPV